MSNVGLILGGGAPNLTLMAGALAALHDRGAKFNAIAASGAGMLVAMLYAAPKGMEPREALEHTKNMGVSDLIYAWFPINYKVFGKPGIAAHLYRKALQPFIEALPEHSAQQALFKDWAHLVAATFCPSDLWPGSQGLCAAAPWIEDVVDFEKLRHLPYDFYINAYDLGEHEMKTFRADQITPDHFRAALAFPFIYPPFRLGQSPYLEGSAVDTFNFEALLHKFHIHEKSQINHLVVVDVLGREELLHPPKHLYDAWVQSIMVPLVSMARDDLHIFERDHLPKYPTLDLKKIKFTVPKDAWPEALDWSRSNLARLFQVGYEGGEEFFATHRAIFSAPPGGPGDQRLKVVS